MVPNAFLPGQLMATSQRFYWQAYLFLSFPLPLRKE